jgi:hypothetical protein
MCRFETELFECGKHAKKMRHTPCPRVWQPGGCGQPTNATVRNYEECPKCKKLSDKEHEEMREELQRALEEMK